MAQQALFEGVIYDDYENQVETRVIGGEAFYVVDDDGFLRHVEAESIDRQILAVFMDQLQQNKELAVDQTLRMMGKDDLFTKAAIDASIRSINIDDILRQGIPQQARDMMAMVGFRVIINIHGEILRVDQPTIEDDDQ
ncbi:MAG: hypothetical protein H6666_05710 [Ardenticatenaceae bacterium]|nr:hypothetical protein [Ardenticatenaceae bacterium]